MTQTLTQVASQLAISRKRLTQLVKTLPPALKPKKEGRAYAVTEETVAALRALLEDEAAAPQKTPATPVAQVEAQTPAGAASVAATASETAAQGAGSGESPAEDAPVAATKGVAASALTEDSGAAEATWQRRFAKQQGTIKALQAQLAATQAALKVAETQVQRLEQAQRSQEEPASGRKLVAHFFAKFLGQDR